MKKILSVLLLTTLSIILASCSQGADSRNASSGKTVNDVLSQQTETASQALSASGSSVGKNTDKKQADVDLTELNSTMVYSEVYNMLSEPKKYIGKTVRMSGSMAMSEGELQTYYACIIKDATACCSQGIEFVLKEGSYPEEGSDITVYGIFDTYKEGADTYCRLKNAVMES